MRKAAFFFALFVLAGAAMGAGDKSFPITIDSPRGGELYAPGQQQIVLLSARTITRGVLVELSRDGGKTFETIGTIDNSKRKRDQVPSLSWTISFPVTGNAIIRATSTDIKHPGNGTSSPFIIGNLNLDSSISDGRYVQRTGDTMSGLLTLSGDPTTNILHAVTKQYVDNGDTIKVGKAGDTMTGLLTLSGDPTSALHSATKQYVDQPKCRVKQVSASTVTNLNPTVLVFTAEDYDTNAMHDPVINASRITCTKAGVYLLSCCVNITGTSGDYHLIIRANGSNAMAETKGPLISTPYNAAALVLQMELSVGDYVEVIFNQSSGATQTVSNLGSGPTFCASRLP